ncbi:MAG: peptide deformylase [Parvibaculales bacterium]
MTIREISEIGSPIIREGATHIPKAGSSETKRLARDMIATMEAKQGVGIAAPQIGSSERMFIASAKPNSRYPHAPEMEPMLVIDPKIKKQSGKIVKDWEGCLSVPNIRGFVPRHEKIIMEYTDENGERKEQAFEGFLARLMQHETDHLNGIVFIDRVETTKDLISEKEYYRRLEARAKAGLKL